MGTQERRARDFDLREQRLLKLAAELLLDQGQDAVTMERLAERAEYAKGTLYKHFGGREDVLCALAVHRFDDIDRILQATFALPHAPRHRLLLGLKAYEIYAAHHPEEFRLISALHSGGFTRISADRLEALDAAQNLLFERIKSLMAEARDLDQLGPLPMSDDAFCFNLWSVCFGSYMLNFADPDLLSRKGLPTVEENLYALMTLILDGAGWQPLSGDTDLRALMGDASAQLGELVRAAER